MREILPLQCYRSNKRLVSFQQTLFWKKGKSCGETEFIGDIASFTGVRIPSPAPFFKAVFDAILAK
jgi:hypothetical protein